MRKLSSTEFEYAVGGQERSHPQAFTEYTPSEYTEYTQQECKVEEGLQTEVLDYVS